MRKSLISLNYALTQTVIPKWVAPPIAREGSITMIVAEPGIGKSNLALAATMHAHLGLPFLGFPQVTCPQVLFLSLDAPQWDYSNVAKAIWTGLGKPDLPQNADVEHDLERDQFYFRHEPLMLDQSGVVDNLRRLFETFDTMQGIAIHPPNVIVIDTLRHIHDQDENDSRLMGHLLRALRSLADDGSAIVLLHHAAVFGRAQGRSAVYTARGSSVLTGGVDLLLNLSAKQEENGKIITGFWAKGRAPDLPERFHYRMTWANGAMVFTPTTPQPKTQWQPIPFQAYTWNELQKACGGAREAKIRRDALGMHETPAGWILGADTRTPDEQAENRKGWKE